jgi:hypothetical protein
MSTTEEPRQRNKLSLPGTPPTAAEFDDAGRLARRIEELRQGGGLADEEADKFHIDPKIVPAGWSYEWKRHTIWNQEDPTYLVELQQHGWDPVPAKRHPELVPRGWQFNTIDRGGQRLYERPAIFTEEAKVRDKERANGQVRDKERQMSSAPAGTFERDNKGDRMATIRKSYEHVPIPKE